MVFQEACNFCSLHRCQSLGVDYQGMHVWGSWNVLSGTEQPSFIFTHIVPVSVSACRSTFPNKHLFPSSELHATGVHSWSCSVAPSTLAPVPPNASWRAGCMQSIFALPCTCSLLPSAILLAWLMLRMPEVWFRLPVAAQLFLPAGRWFTDALLLPEVFISNGLETGKEYEELSVKLLPIGSQSYQLKGKNWKTGVLKCLYIALNQQLLTITIITSTHWPSSCTCIWRSAWDTNIVPSP